MLCKYFVENKQQFGGSMENIQLQVLRRMWIQTFSHMFKQGRDDHTEAEWTYLGVTYKMLGIENGFWDELLRVVVDEDYHQSNDGMVKVRMGLGLRGRKNTKQHNPASLNEGDKHFEHLCSLE